MELCNMKVLPFRLDRGGRGINRKLLISLILVNLPQFHACLLQDIAIKGNGEFEMDAEPVEGSDDDAASLLPDENLAKGLL